MQEDVIRCIEKSSCFLILLLCNLKRCRFLTLDIAGRGHLQNIIYRCRNLVGIDKGCFTGLRPIVVFFSQFIIFYDFNLFDVMEAGKRR
jgi:hypothetical protein